MQKKILVLGVSFNDAFGVGVTLRNLFAQIPPEQVSVIDTGLTFDDFRYAGSLFNLEMDQAINSEARSGSIPTIPKAGSQLKDTGVLRIQQKAVLFILAIRKYLAYYYNNFVPLRLTDNLKRFISEVRPDYLYVVPYNRRMIRLALQISTGFKIPLVVHIMDDFRKRSPKDPIYFLNEYLTGQSIRKIVNRADKCLSICESMSTEYERLFHRTFYSFHNPVKTENFNFNNPSFTGREKDSLRIVYAGTIAENNIDTLIFFSKACEKFSMKDEKLVFDIFSPANESNVFYKRLKNTVSRFSAVFLKEKLGHAAIIPTMCTYDLLLLPLTFSSTYHHVIKFSFPTKVAEYMATGIPTLFIIPKGISLHTFLEENNFGFLIDQPGEKPVIEFLSTLRQLLVQHPVDERARHYAFQHFNSTEVSMNFKNIFS